MEINGTCLCGDIRWQAIIDPALVGVCHCTDCQTVGGSAFQFTTRVAREDFHLTTGELAAYVKVAESGNPRAMSFCGRCATMIHTGNTDDTGPFLQHSGQTAPRLGRNHVHDRHAGRPRKGFEV